jgi:hypothetical protein
MRENALADFMRRTGRTLVATVAILLSAAEFFPFAVYAGTFQTVIPEKAQSFPLSQVRLLDGPFRDAMLRDEKYLLSLDPDRLLHTLGSTSVFLPPPGRSVDGRHRWSNCAGTASGIISPRCR